MWISVLLGCFSLALWTGSKQLYTSPDTHQPYAPVSKMQYPVPAYVEWKQPYSLLYIYIYIFVCTACRTSSVYMGMYAHRVRGLTYIETNVCRHESSNMGSVFCIKELKLNQPLHARPSFKSGNSAGFCSSFCNGTCMHWLLVTCWVFRYLCFCLCVLQVQRHTVWKTCGPFLDLISSGLKCSWPMQLKANESNEPVWRMSGTETNRSKAGRMLSWLNWPSSNWPALKLPEFI